MTIFYVDQSIISGGAGTSSNPFGAVDFIAHTNAVHSYNHIYMIRGIRDYSNDPMFNNGFIFLNGSRSNNPSFKPWNAKLYGPWRMKANRIEFNKALLVLGGIIEVSDQVLFSSGLTSGITRDMFVRSTGDLISGFNFEGCTILTTGLGSLYINSPVSFKDCAIDCALSLHVNSSDIIMNSCACTLNTIGVTGTNNQFGWIPANPFPAWNDGSTTSTASDDFTSWEFETLGSTITISGSGDYVHYPSGLFGEIRDNIGAWHFNVLPIDRSTSWMFTAGYSNSKKKYRVSGTGSFPTIIHAPLTASTDNIGNPGTNPNEPITENLLTSELRNEDRIITVVTEYTVVQP